MSRQKSNIVVLFVVTVAALGADHARETTLSMTFTNAPVFSIR